MFLKKLRIEFVLFNVKNLWNFKNIGGYFVMFVLRQVGYIQIGLCGYLNG